MATTVETTVAATCTAPPARSVTSADEPPGLDALLHAIDDLVVALQEAERPASAGEVVDVAGRGADEVVDLAHERRQDRQGDADERGQHDQQRRQHREPAARQAVRWNQATSGSSATARKTAISSQTMIWRVSQSR